MICITPVTSIFIALIAKSLSLSSQCVWSSHLCLEEKWSVHACWNDVMLKRSFWYRSGLGAGYVDFVIIRQLTRQKGMVFEKRRVTKWLQKFKVMLGVISLGTKEQKLYKSCNLLEREMINLWMRLIFFWIKMNLTQKISSVWNRRIYKHILI